jgi:hypothetical protein
MSFVLNDVNGSRCFTSSNFLIRSTFYAFCRDRVLFCWRREFGGLKTDQVKRLKGLESENARLRRAVSDLTLDKMILAEAAKGNF